MSRADRVAGRLSEKGVDLLLVTHLPNLRYLTGFTGTNGMAVVGKDVRRFVTDFRYVEQAKAQVPDFDREQAPQEFLTALADVRVAAVSGQGVEGYRAALERLKAAL